MSTQSHRWSLAVINAMMSRLTDPGIDLALSLDKFYEVKS